MPLKLAHFDDPSKPKGQVAVLNKWADWVETQLHATQQKIFKVSSTAVANIPPAPAPVTSKGDGLTHGDAIWELDPGWTILRDDFNSPPTTTATSNVILTFGNGLSWNMTVGNSTSFYSNGPFPMNGVVAQSTTSTAGTVSFQRLVTSTTNNGFPLLDYPGWKIVWIFQVGRNNAIVSAPAFNWSKVSFYMGLASYGATSSLISSNSPRPPHFLGLRFDTDTTAPAISDTQFVFEYVNNLTASPTNRQNTQGTTALTGISAVEGKIYRFEMSCVTSGQIIFLLTDGTTVFTNTMNVSKISTSASQPTFSTSNGIVQAQYVATNTMPFEVGTKVTIASGSIAAGNGSFVGSVWGAGTNAFAFQSGSTITGTDTGATTTFYPGLGPFLAFGNDTQASPVTDSKGVLLDFFSFVWNKGLISGGATSNSTLARYW